MRKNLANHKISRRQQPGGFGVILAILMFIAVVGSLGFYLREVNQSAATGFQINELENTKKKLTETKQKLEMAKIELGQIGRIELLAKNMGMSKSEAVDYLIEEKKEVARR